MREVIEEPAEELRQLHLARLERLLMAAWPRALGGQKVKVRDGKRWKWVTAAPENESIDRVLKILKQIADLQGLDAPRRTHIGGDKDAPPISVDVNQAITWDDLDELPLSVRLAMLEFLQGKQEKAGKKQAPPGSAIPG
jgi:hypothetical protein